MSATILIAVALVVGAPVTIDEPMLAGLPLTTASFTAHGKTQSCEGPLLRDLVASLGVPTGESLRGPALAQGVLITARDGYRVVFSLGELMPSSARQEPS